MIFFSCRGSRAQRSWRLDRKKTESPTWHERRNRWCSKPSCVNDWKLHCNSKVWHFSRFFQYLMIGYYRVVKGGGPRGGDSLMFPNISDFFQEMWTWNRMWTDLFLKGKNAHKTRPCPSNQNWVVVSNMFYFHPFLGKWSNLTNIFQMGWFNHQLENKGPHLGSRKVYYEGPSPHNCSITSWLINLPPPPKRHVPPPPEIRLY